MVRGRHLPALAKCSDVPAISRCSRLNYKCYPDSARIGIGSRWAPPTPPRASPPRTSPRSMLSSKAENEERRCRDGRGRVVKIAAPTVRAAPHLIGPNGRFWKYRGLAFLAPRKVHQVRARVVGYTFGYKTQRRTDSGVPSLSWKRRRDRYRRHARRTGGARRKGLHFVNRFVYQGGVSSANGEAVTHEDTMFPW